MLANAKTNLESASITALILTLIAGALPLFENLYLLTFVGVLSMASKHIFNPTAVAVFLSAILLGNGASWWIGNTHILPVIILGGVLVLVKIRRVKLVLSFLAIYFLNAILFGRSVSVNTFLAPSIWFFALVMLVEPLTCPSTKYKQIIFGGFVALVYILLPKVIPGYAYGLEFDNGF